MKTLIIILFSILLICSGCEKLKPTYIIEGFLYNDCSKDPVVHTPLELHYKIGLFTDKGIFDETSTDGNGYFKFEYKPKSGVEMSIQGEGLGDEVIRKIPLERHIDLGEVYMEETGKVEIFLEVKNSYSNLDTLYVKTDKNLNFDLVLPGPFSTSSIGTVEVIKNRDRLYSFNSIDKGTVTWYINKVSVFNLEKKDFELHGCGVVDSVSIEI